MSTVTYSVMTDSLRKDTI